MEEAPQGKNIRLKQERLGQKRKMLRSGRVATCVQYYSASNIVIEFENGERLSTYWRSFDKGQILSQQNKYIGQKRRTVKHGVCECIKYRNSRDCDFRFEDTGYIAKHKNIYAFLSGHIADHSKDF